jgi:hypothetical protein
MSIRNRKLFLRIEAQLMPNAFIIVSSPIIIRIIIILYICILSHIAISLPLFFSVFCAQKTQETKGTNEHDKKEQKKKGTAISLKTSINTRRWPNWAETRCVILKFKV